MVVPRFTLIIDPAYTRIKVTITTNPARSVTAMRTIQFVEKIGYGDGFEEFF